MPLRRSRAPRRNEFCRKLVRLRMRSIVCVGKHNGPGDGRAFKGTLAFIRPALLVLGQEIDGVAFECSLQLVPIKIPAQLFSLLLQLHPKVNR